jgi:7-cyano-7-deazaguanine synthase
MIIETPIISLSKAEIVQWGRDLAAPLEHTWTCYQSGAVPCAVCDSCLLRAKGFASAGYADPLLVRLKGESG